MNIISDQLDGPSAGIVGEPVDLDTFADALGGMPTDPQGAATMRRMHAEHLHAATNRPLVGPCPPWCEEPSGHDWEAYAASDIEEIQFMRTHVRVVGALGVRVSLLEYSDGEPVTASVDYDEPGSLDNTPDRARRVASDLLDAARVLDPGGRQAPDERDREIEAAEPTVIPACPSWCTLAAGHDYPSADLGEHGVTFSREHLAASFDHVEVYATESNTAGAVTLASPLAWIITDDRPHKDHDAGQLLQIAAEVLNAADVLDGITLCVTA